MGALDKGAPLLNINTDHQIWVYEFDANRANSGLWQSVNGIPNFLADFEWAGRSSKCGVRDQSIF